MIKVRDGYGKLIGSDYNGNIAHVLLSNGGNLQYAVGSTASTLVLRNASGQIESSVASTVAPFVISSTKVNTNLNADLLDGFLATGLFQSLTSAADKNLYIKIGNTEKEVPLLYASYLGGVTKEGLFTEFTNVNDSTNPNSIKVTIGDTTKYLKVAYSDLAGKVVCSSSTNDVDRPIVVTNKSNGVYYSTKVTLNYSTGNVTAPTFTGALIGNADTATTASKLSTVSKTAWGLTYWTSDGVPTSISGDMIGVENITFNKEKAFNIVSGGSFLPTSNTDDYWWGVHRYDTNVAIAVMPASGTFQSKFETHLAFGSGNVGIGNTSPQQKLDVSGKIKADALYLTRSNGDVAFTIAEESGTNGYNISASGGSSFIRFYTNSGGSTAVEQMRIHTNGYVGIGTPTPGHKLHVVGNTWAAGFIKQDSSDDYVLLGGGGHKLLSELGISGGPYLPLSGGVLSGHLALGTPATTALLLLSIERNNNKLSMLISGANEGWLVNNFSSGKSTALIQNETRGLLFKDTYDNYFNVWHSGNDGSGSGLDADLLDGLHLFGVGNGTSGVAFIGGNGVMEISSIIDFHTNNSDGNDFNTRLYSTGIYKNQVQLPTSSGTLALTTDNVASATKLENNDSYTAWGQTFFINGKPNNIYGTAYFPNGDLIYAKDEGGANQYILGFTSSLGLGYGSAGAGYDTYILGNNIHFRYSTSRITGFTLNSSGNVGIGTTSPTTKLDVHGALKIFDYIDIREPNTKNRVTAYAYSGIGRLYSYNDDTGYNDLYVGQNSTNAIVVKANGNVGIGTGSPAYKLDVNGDIATSLYLRIKAWSGYGSGICSMWYNGNTTQLVLDSGASLGYNLDVNGTISTNSSNAMSLKLNSSNISYGFAYNAIGIYHSNVQKGGLGWNSEGKGLTNAGLYLKNYVSGDCISLFNEGGICFIGSNVGIGTASPTKKLHIYSDSSSYDSLVLLEKGGAYDVRFELANSIDALRVIQQSSGNAFISLNGNHSLNLETSNTVRFTIDGSGNVGIGTPTPGYKLHVAGTTFSTGFVKSESSDSYVLLGGGGHKAESSLSVNYATSAGNADTVDSCHKDDFLRRTDTLGYLNKFVLEDIPKGVTQVGSIGWTDYQNHPHAGGLWMTLRGTSSLRTALILFPSYSMSSPPILYSSVDGGAWQGGYQLAYTSQIPTTMAWGSITGKPSTFTPSSHTHDDRYYTESEADSRFINYTGDTMTGALTIGQKVSARKATWLKLVTPGHTGSPAWCVGVDDTTDNSYLYMKYNESETSYFYVRHDGCAFAPHFYESSDQRLKENIKAILDRDNMPQIKEFDWKESGEHSYGLIAQELEEQGYSELVSTKDDGYKTVNYSAALSLIVGKLQVKIKELEKEIEILKNKN